MLKSLYIRNYAIIQELELKLDNGLSTITGETGAGKSILLGALGLILGQRADTNVLQNPDEKLVVEGSFDIRPYRLNALFEEYEAEYEDTTLIRRMINPSGKSRAFVNDVPVTLNFLKKLGGALVDIHSQHSNLLLNDALFQLKLIDSFSHAAGLLDKYSKAYKHFRQVEKDYTDLQAEADKNRADQDYYQFQYAQLEEARLQENEQQSLEEEAGQLNHTEEIKGKLSLVQTAIQDESSGAETALQQARQAVAQLTAFFPKAQELHQRLESALIEIQDIASEVEIENADVGYSPERLAAVEERLDLIYSLQQKHHVGTVAELLRLRDEFSEKLQQIRSYDGQLEALGQSLQEARQNLTALADKLTALRKKVLGDVEQAVHAILQRLGMPNARFSVVHGPLDGFGPHGQDKITFLFSANSSMDPQPVSKVASGGELSRIMLAIKALIARTTAMPTIVFDEIDMGVSGDVATRMGEIMKSMAARMQVINITHLPQVAAKGDHHFRVYKEDARGHTQSGIIRLTGEGRVREIAKMLSGTDLTPAALENARVLLSE